MKTLASLVVVACLLSIAGPARPSGYEVAQQSATSAGTAHAGLARSEDPAAAWYNPAALADDFGLRIGVGVTLGFPSIEASASDDSWQGETELKVITPPHAYLSYAQDDWALGLAFNVPFASNITWSQEWARRFDIVASRPQFFRLAPFFAYRFGPVRVAAGPQVDIGRVEIKRGLDFIDTEGDVRILMSGYGFGGHFSAFWEISDSIDVGIHYKSRTFMVLKGDADFTSPDAFAPQTTDQAAEAKWMLPDRLATGIFARVGPVRLLADLSLTFWTVNDELNIDFENEDTPDRKQPNDWSLAFAVRGGAEWDPWPIWTIRAGLYFDQSPIPSENLYPSSPDSDRIGLTLGSGVRLGDHWHIDVFYEYLTLLSRSSTSTDAPSASYSGSIHLFGVGVRFELPLGEG